MAVPIRWAPSGARDDSQASAADAAASHSPSGCWTAPVVDAYRWYQDRRCGLGEQCLAERIMPLALPGNRHFRKLFEEDT